MSLLIAKIIVSVCLVLGLSWVAEKANPRIAGILSGMPLGAVLVLFFVGTDLGPEFATTSALYAIPSITSTVAFSIGYYFTSRLKIRFSKLLCSIVGIIFYLVIALILNTLNLNLTLGVALSLITLIVVGYAFRSQDSNKIQKRIKMTFPRLLFRSGMAASFVVTITTFADFFGAQWSGLLIGFPMTFLPFLLIIHITYSGGQVRTIIRNFPLGLVGLLCFLIVVNQTIPLVGVNLAILMALSMSMIYLSLLGLALNHFKSALAE
jgi:uncharacterized membrane protein (GlpM family)